jgi:hypothetical protein
MTAVAKTVGDPIEAAQVTVETETVTSPATAGLEGIQRRRDLCGLVGGRKGAAI